MGVTIAEMIRRLKSVDIPKETIVILMDQKEDLAQMNRDQLYKLSIDKNGLELYEYKDDAYAKYKHKKNPLPGWGRPDFYLTGAFQRGMYAQVKGGKTLMFGSTDYKSADLERRDGKEIFGLTKDNKKIYRFKFYYPRLKMYITEKTGLKFT